MIKVCMGGGMQSEVSNGTFGSRHMGVLSYIEKASFRVYRVRSSRRSFSSLCSKPWSQSPGGVFNSAYFELCSTGVISVAHHELIGTQQNGRTCRQARCCLPIAIAWVPIHLNNKQLPIVSYTTTCSSYGACIS